MRPSVNEAERISINNVFDVQHVNINSIKPQSGSGQNVAGMANLLNTMLWVEDRESSSAAYPSPQDQNRRVSINCFDAGGSNVHVCLLPNLMHLSYSYTKR